MADINNFGLKGLGSLVQFGKRGLKLLTNTTDNEFTFTDNDGSTLVEVKGADAKSLFAVAKDEFVKVFSFSKSFPSTRICRGI